MPTSDLKKADALFSKQIRERAEGKCWGVGKTSFDCSGYLQCAHIVSRRYRATRWVTENAVCLCAAHHLFWTHHPLEWMDVMGPRFDEMHHKALNDPPEKARDAVQRLKG